MIDRPAPDSARAASGLRTAEAAEIGFIDAAFSSDMVEFDREVADVARVMASDSSFWIHLREKHERRLCDERKKALASYRDEELRRMRMCFYGRDTAYHEARRRFVRKETRSTTPVAPSGRERQATA